MGWVTLPGGSKYRAYVAPPGGFDPLAAGREALLRHGYPARPEPHLVPLWEDLVRSRRRYVPPEVRTDVVPARRSAGLDPPVQDTYEYCGAYVNAPAGASLRMAVAVWTVPLVYSRADNQDYHCSIWVG